MNKPVASIRSIVTVDAKLFNAALTRVVGAIDRNKKFPILGCVRLEAVDGTLELIATDTVAQIVERIPAEGDCPPTCIDFQRLAALVSAVKDRGDLTFEISKTDAVMKSGRSRFTLGTLDAEGFPNLMSDKLPVAFDVSGPKLASIMTALEPAISTETARYYLAGIYFSPGGVHDERQRDHLTGVATDGHKIYARHIEVPDLPAAMAGIIVPGPACSRIAKLFGDAPMLHVTCSDKKLAITFEATDYLTVLVEAQYPDWRRVIPRQPTAFSYDVAALKRAATAVAASKSAEKGGKAVKLAFGEDETTLIGIDRNDPSFSGSDVCRHSVIGESPVAEIGINVDYLIEMLDHLGAETVEIGPVEGQGAIALRGTTFDDRLIGIMPVRV